MGQISVVCSNCQGTFAVNPNLAGKSVHCLECGELIAVPTPESEAVVYFEESSSPAPDEDLGPFNPYEQWLGISKREQPPNYYTLLGLQQFENDPSVIEAAVASTVSRLSPHRDGAKGHIADELIQRVQKAGAGLLDPQKRAEYLRRLAKGLPQKKPGRIATSHGQAATVSTASGAPESAASNRKSAKLLMVVLGGLGVAGLVIGVMLLRNSSDSNATSNQLAANERTHAVSPSEVGESVTDRSSKTSHSESESEAETASTKPEASTASLTRDTSSQSELSETKRDVDDSATSTTPAPTKAEMVENQTSSRSAPSRESETSETPSAASANESKPVNDGEIALATRASAVFKSHCYSCHGDGGTDEGGMNYVMNLKRLVGTGMVVAGKPEESPLFKRILSGEMPPEGSGKKFSQNDIDVIREWITANAPQPPTSSDRTFISYASVFDAIRKDLDAAEERDKRYLRYFSLTHQYNAGLSDGELETFRLALSKLLNSLSWERELIQPQPIDDPATIFRIDLRSLGWSQATWDRILSLYPYGLRDSRLKNLGELNKATETLMPVVRADWFVAAASIPPLYHEVLEMPQTVAELESLLRIKFSQNVTQDRAARAGFTESGISEHPRIIERHDIAEGYCWISHDFSGDSGTQNFFSHPLHFQQDGGEIIFSLPNGMQAYLLVTSKGDRIDKAPTAIVKDPLQPEATVVNGISYMRCHSAGIIPKRDEVRETVLANPAAYTKELETIKAIYVPNEQLSQKIEADRRHFQQALSAIGITRFSDKAEPIFNMARRFDEALDVNLAAAELGMSVPEFLQKLDRDRNLQRTLGVFRVSGGTLKRTAFEEYFSLTAKSFGLGFVNVPESSWRHAPTVAASQEPDNSKESTSTASDKEFKKLGGRNRWPTFLERSRWARSTKEGLQLNGRSYIRSDSGRFLEGDFIMELIVEMKEGDSNQIAFVGIGEGVPGRPYNEPANSINFRIHPPNVSDGEVALAKAGAANETLGRVLKAGTHRVVIEKIDDTIRFAFDVDNDGESSDDIEQIIPDFKAYAPFLHEKNAYLFFGGGGTYKEIRIESKKPAKK